MEGTAESKFTLCSSLHLVSIVLFLFSNSSFVTIRYAFQFHFHLPMLPIVISLQFALVCLPHDPFTTFSFLISISFHSSRNKSKSSCLALMHCPFLVTYSFMEGPYLPSSSDGFLITPHHFLQEFTDCRFQLYIFIEKNENVTSDLLRFFYSFTPTRP